MMFPCWQYVGIIEKIIFDSNECSVHSAVLRRGCERIDVRIDGSKDMDYNRVKKIYRWRNV